MTRARVLNLAVLAAASLVSTVSGAGMYAFYTDHGVQVGMQDAKSGDIWHSYCNVQSTPVFPVKLPNVLKTGTKPRKGSPVAATGWWDTRHVIASVFWQAEDNSIINGYYQCNMDSGILEQQGEYVISRTAGVDNDDIHESSGLSVELLGNTGGYRVFYHNKKSQVAQMSYTTDIDWVQSGVISQHATTGMALNSVHSAANNVSVVFPMSSTDIEVSRLNQDDTWHLASFPNELKHSPDNNTAPSNITVDSSVDPDFTLPAWNGQPDAIGIAVDGDYTRMVFYIGTDKRLYESANINFQWKLQSNQSSKLWPVADEAGGPLAVTSNFDTSETWVYYSSNGSLVQAYRDGDGLWNKATTLSTTPESSNDSGSEGSDSSDGNDGGDASDSDSQDNSGSSGSTLSTGAKAGIGIGVSIGAIGVGLLALLFFIRRRRQLRKRQQPAGLDEYQQMNPDGYNRPRSQGSFGPTLPSSPDAMPAPAYNATWNGQHPAEKQAPAEVDAMPRPTEMEQPQVVHELGQNEYSHELDAVDSEHRR